MFWRKSVPKGELSIFFATDLHGSTTCFKKFVNAAQFYGANALLLGGDMTGKAIVPVTRVGANRYMATDGGVKIELEGESALHDFMAKVENMGFYGVVLTPAEKSDLDNSEEARDRLFRRLVVERVEEWIDFASKKLDGTAVRIVSSPGNDDFYEIDEVLKSASIVDYHDQEVTTLGDYQILHCGGSTVTPWDTEREYSEDQYEEIFDGLRGQIKTPGRCIFNVHVPPRDTALDECPKLNEDLKVVFEMGNPAKMHAGSSAVRKAIEEIQPLIGLHGHIHEGRASIKIGRTTCVNPGSTYSDGVLQGVLVSLSGEKVSSVQMLQG
jgi:Icc-related predicted phosphoesterase